MFETERVRRFVDGSQHEFKCRITFRGTEGVSSGYVWLTEEEYSIVERALNVHGWEDACIDTWSGEATIELPPR